MLELEGIHTYYGLSHILFGVSLKVEGREVVCLLGRNGAGKTTTLKSIVGLTPPKRGIIRFKGEEITGQQPYRVTRRGMSLVPDDRRIFADLTVGENLEIGVRKAQGGEGWDQKMLAIARALMGNPELLLLDEPTEGLAPALVRSLEGQIRKLRETGLTVLLAEQNVRSALRLCDRGYIIDNGEIRYQGSIDELRKNEEVRKKYLLV
jgi:branched-chain amino acid transport system ATP-binding protein